MTISSVLLLYLSFSVEIKFNIIFEIENDIIFTKIATELIFFNTVIQFYDSFLTMKYSILQNDSNKQKMTRTILKKL